MPRPRKVALALTITSVVWNGYLAMMAAEPFPWICAVAAAGVAAWASVLIYLLPEAKETK